MKKFNSKIEMDVIHQITMLLQIALAIFAITFAVAGFYCREFYIACEIIVGLLMFVIAYNNQTVYKRKYMTPVYVGLGIVIIASALFA